MRFVLIRHGQSVADLDPRRFEGSVDFPLTEYGERQAHRLAQRVAAEYRLDIVVASPLQRARKTAEILADYCGCDVRVDDRLRERSHGVLGGMTREDADVQYPLPTAGRHCHEAPPEGESYLQQYGRVAEFWFENYYGRNSGGEPTTVGVVAHGGTIQCLYHAALGLPPTTGASFGCTDTGLHEWQFVPGGKIRIALANCTRHLLQPQDSRRMQGARLAGWAGPDRKYMESRDFFE